MKINKLVVTVFLCSVLFVFLGCGVLKQADLLISVDPGSLTVDASKITDLASSIVTMKVTNRSNIKAYIKTLELSYEDSGAILNDYKFKYNYGFYIPASHDRDQPQEASFEVQVLNSAMKTDALVSSVTSVNIAIKLGIVDENNIEFTQTKNMAIIFFTSTNVAVQFQNVTGPDDSWNNGKTDSFVNVYVVDKIIESKADLSDAYVYITNITSAEEANTKVVFISGTNAAWENPETYVYKFKLNFSDYSKTNVPKLKSGSSYKMMVRYGSLNTTSVATGYISDAE